MRRSIATRTGVLTSVVLGLAVALFGVTASTGHEPSVYVPYSASVFSPAVIPYGNLQTPQPTASPSPSPSPSPTPSPRPTVTPRLPVFDKAELKLFALHALKDNATQFSCLDRLWTRESGWNPYARNKSSGAYGIPQALPGSRMAIVAADWKTNPYTQIMWGLGYIHGRYVTPCKAWSHSQTYGWY